VSSIDTIVGVLNAQHASAELIAQICIDLVDTWASNMTIDAMYRDLLENAKSPASVDALLYQLEGDPAYAENAALIVLSAAWNYPELTAQIKRSAQNVLSSPRSDAQRALAVSVLYGMYLMARGGAKVSEVAYRNADGQIETLKLDGKIPAASLFDSVRELYAASL
jgi:hypothetical protein